MDSKLTIEEVFGIIDEHIARLEKDITKCAEKEKANLAVGSKENAELYCMMSDEDIVGIYTLTKLRQALLDANEHKGTKH